MQQFEHAVSEHIGGPARRRVILALACVLALQSADLGTTGAVAVPLQRTFQITNAELGLLVSVTLFAGALATLPAGVLVDRVNRTRLLAGSIVVWCVAIGVVGASQSYLMLVLSRVALGVVTATALPAIASLTGDFFPGRERARVFGYILGGELVGAGLGFLVSGNIANFVTWRFSFWWLIVPGLALAWVLWQKLPEPARGGQSRIGFQDEEIPSVDEPPRGERDAQQQSAKGESLGQRAAREAGVQPHKDLVLHTDPERMSTWDAVRYVLRIRTNVLLIIASALGYSFFEAARTLGLLFIRSRYSLGQSTATLMVVGLGLGALIGVVASGHLSEWLAERGKLNARILVPAGAFAVCAATFGPGIYSSTLWVSAPLFCLGGAALAATNPPMDAARLDVMHFRLWGRAEGVRTVLRSVFEGAAPLGVGVLADAFSGQSYSNASQGATLQDSQGLAYALLIALVPVVIAAVILLFARGSYAADAATAAASEQQTQHGRPAGKSG